MEKMEVNLFIDSVLFQYDRAKNILFQAEKTENRVELDRCLQDNRHYFLRFNYKTDAISIFFGDSVQSTHDAPEIKIILPKDVFSMDESSISHFNQLSEERNWGFLLADRLTMDRINGKLPLANIKGEKYYIDIQADEFRHVENPGISFRISDLTSKHPTYELKGLYNTRTKRLERWDNPICSANDLLVLEMPSLQSLDTIGIHRKFGLDDIMSAKDIPAVGEWKIKTRPLTPWENKKRLINRIKKGLKKKRKGLGH